MDSEMYLPAKTFFVKITY